MLTSDKEKLTKGSKLGTVFAFFCNIGQNCSFLGCGHSTKKDFSCERSIYIANNMHTVYSGEGIADFDHTFLFFNNFTYGQKSDYSFS